MTVLPEKKSKLNYDDEIENELPMRGSVDEIEKRNRVEGDRNSRLLPIIGIVLIISGYLAYSYYSTYR